MTIDPAVIEKIKQETDLAGYIRSRGVLLKEVGQNFKGLCPFHEEKAPSFTVNPRENLWQCFGCGSGGDVFTFVERLDKVGFAQAVKTVARDRGIKLGDLSIQPTATNAPTKKAENTTILQANIQKVRKQKLLNHVMKFYQQELHKDKRGLNYLKNRGISDFQSLEDFGAGFVAGNLTNVMPSDEGTLKSLQEVGVLNKNGHEMFFGCVVFPLTDFEGNVLSIYGRRIDKDQVAHLYLPGPRQGLVNWQAAKRSRSIILTESIIDALALYSRGLKNVIPVYGTNGFTASHEELFNKFPVEHVFIIFDNDTAGDLAAQALKIKLKQFSPSGKRVRVDVVSLPKFSGKDVNDYFLYKAVLTGQPAHSADDFRELLVASKQEKEPASLSDEPVKAERFYEPTPHGFRIYFGKREYEVKGIARMGTQLKATLKASGDIGSNDRFQITTIDLYSHRSREWFAKVLSELFGERFEIVFEDLNKILVKVEAYKPAAQDGLKKAKELTEAEKNEAMAFLKSPNLLSEVLADLEFLGFTGEETNKLIAYLVAVSRKMEEPLSLLIQSRSAAGKSTLQDAILDLVPEEDKVKYTRLTDQALFYKDENSLVHKILAIEEAAGIGGSAYSIRALQSAKELTVAATSKDPTTGKLKTEEYKVNGPLSFMLTTTAVNLDAEMESRFLAVSIDESIAMTQRIHSKQRESETLDGYLHKKNHELAIQRHQNAQRLLKPLVVVNPYAPQLVFPSDNLRSRRDHKKYLGLIKAIAFLHQYQRKIKTAELASSHGMVEYIEVTRDDIKKANDLACEVLGRSLDELSAPSRTLLGLIQKMVEEHTRRPDSNITPIHFSFNRRMIREYSKWSDWQVKTHIQELEDMGYLYPHMGSKGKEYVYELKQVDEIKPHQKVFWGLTNVESLVEPNKKFTPQLKLGSG